LATLFTAGTYAIRFGAAVRAALGAAQILLKCQRTTKLRGEVSGTREWTREKGQVVVVRLK
jgi:hypothetical protein